MVDIIAGGYDALVRPEAKPEETRSSFDTRGAGRFKQWLRRLDYGIIPIIGAGGQGKTALMCAIADRWPRKRRFIAGVPAWALENTPLEPREFTAANVRSLPPNSAMLVPDAGLVLDARTYGSVPEEALREIAQIARHRDIVFVLDVQYSKLLAQSAFLTRCVVYKHLGQTWKVTERDGLIGLARQAMAAFNEEIPPEERIRHAYVYADEVDFAGFISYAPPEWFSDDISKSHAQVVDAKWREVETE